MGLRSAPGAFDVVNPFVWGRPVGSLEYVPEAWQRVVWAWQGWLGRHEGLVGCVVFLGLGEFFFP